MFKSLFKISVYILVLQNYIFFPNNVSASILGNFKFSKKTTKVNQRRTVGSGSRSQCIPSVNNHKGIELLVPNISVAHHTISENPPLYLYSRLHKPLSLTFTLVDPQSPQPLVEKQIKIEKPGIKKLSLPTDAKLENEGVYLWYVAIPCKNNSQDYQTVLNAGIEKIKPSPNTTTKLNNTISNLEKIEIYSENGLWYEIIDLVLQDFSEQEIDAFLALNIFSQNPKIE